MRYCNGQLRRWALPVVLLGCLMPATVATAGGDVRVNQNTLGVQNEPSITVNRSSLFPGNVVVGYNERPGSARGLGISYSPDYGVTWTDAHTGFVWGNEGEASLASDLLGNVFAGMVSFGNSPPLVYPSNGVYVYVSIDGGATWSTPTTVDQYASGGTPAYFAEKDYLTTDTYAGSPYTNNLYVVWQRDDANGVNSDVYFAWSNDKASTFHYATGVPLGRISDLPSTPGTPAVQSSVADGAMAAVAPDGTIYVVWQDAPVGIATKGTIYMDKSTDGGQTWGTDVVATHYDACGRNSRIPAGFRIQSPPCIAVSPVMNGSSNYDVYVAYAADPDRQNEVSIESDTPGANPSSGPQLASDQQYVYAVWIDGRNGGDVYFNRSSNAGSTWGTDVRINNGVGPGAEIPTDARIFADPAAPNCVYVVWATNRNGNSDIYFNRSLDNGVTWSTDTRVDLGTAAGADYSSQPQIAAEGTNVYVAWLDTRFSSPGDEKVVFNYSNDNGATWQSSSLRLDGSPSATPCTTPLIRCWTTDVYVTWIENQAPSAGTVMSISSHNHGGTWGTAQVLSTTNAASSPCMCNYNAKVYVGWVDSRFGGWPVTDVYFNTSHDGGNTWQALDTRLDSGMVPGTAHCLDLDLACCADTVYAVWSDYRNGQPDIYLNRSLDGGLTWPTPGFRFEKDLVPGANNSYVPHVSAQPGRAYIVWEDHRNGLPGVYSNFWTMNGSGGYPQYDFRLAAGDLTGLNQSNTPVVCSSGNFVYTAWEDYRNGQSDIYVNCSSDLGGTWRDGPDQGDIMLVRSADGGATWGTPVRVNNDATTRSQFHPSIKVASNGAIYAIWYDWRNDPSDRSAEVFTGVSFDRGSTFINNGATSDVSQPPYNAGAWWPWQTGRYDALDLANNSAYIVWSDTRPLGADMEVYLDRVGDPTGVEDGTPVPDAAYLAQNVPNPFNPTTTISFGLATRGTVSLCVYDVSGKLVRALVNGVRPAGDYHEAWDGRDARGNRVSSGVYFCRLTTPGFERTRKLVLLK